MTEHDIVFERGCAWVLRNRGLKRFEVLISGLTHSTSDSAYPMTSDGLSIAIARAEYLAAQKDSGNSA